MDTYALILDDLVRLVNDNYKAAIEDGGRGVEKVAEYAAERTAHLATMIQDPGFSNLVAAEADSVALKAATELVAQADATDARLNGMLEGAMRLGARLLTVAGGNLGAIIPTT